MRNEVVKLAVILFVITALSGLILAFSHNLTKDIIAQALEKEISGPEVANIVVPGSSIIVELEDQALVEKIKSENEKFENLRVCKDDSGNVLGYAITTKSPIKGYSGDIELIVGISLEGKVSGIKVVSHNETVGLGANIEKDSFKNQYIGKSTDNNIVLTKSEPNENEVQSIGGATFSSKSFTSAVNNAIDIFNNYVNK